MSGVLENLKKIEYTDFEKFVEDINRNFAVIENSPLYKGIPGKEGDPGTSGLRGQRGSNFTFVKESKFRETFGDISKGSDVNQEYLNLKLNSFENKQQLLTALNVTELVDGDVIVLTNSLMLRYNVIDETFEDTGLAFNEETNVVTSIETQIENKVAKYFEDHPEFAGEDVFKSFVTYAKNYTDNNNVYVTSKQTESSVYAPYYPGVSTTNGVKLTDHKYFGFTDNQIPKTGRGTMVFGSIKKYIELLMSTIDNTEDETLSSDYAPGENNIPSAVFLQDTLNNGLLFGYKGKTNLKSFGSMYKDGDDNVVLKSDSSKKPAEFSQLMMNKSRLTYDKHLYLPKSMYVGQSLAMDDYASMEIPLGRTAFNLDEGFNSIFDMEFGPRPDNEDDDPSRSTFTSTFLKFRKFAEEATHSENVMVMDSDGEVSADYYLDKRDINSGTWNVQTGAFASSYQIKQLKDMIAGTQTGSSSLYARKASNLSDLTNKDSALTNLGGGTIGKAIFKYTKPLSDSYIRANAAGNISIMTKSGVRSDIGADNASYITKGTLSWDRINTVPVNKGGTGATSGDSAIWNLGGRNAGRRILKTDKSTRGSSIYMRFNTDGTISQRTMSEVRSDLGFTTLGNNLRAMGNPSSTAMIQVATNGTVTHRSLSSVRSDIGANNASNLTTGTINSARYSVVPLTKGGTGATTADQARRNLGGSTAGRALFTKGNPGSTSMFQVLSNGTVNHRTLSQVRSDIGANNASNLTTGTINSARYSTVPVSKGGTGATNGDSAMWNLGMRTAGRNIAKIDKPSGNIPRYMRINPDGTIAQRSYDNVHSDLGVGNVGKNLYKLGGDGATRFLKINSNNSVSKESGDGHLSSLGFGSAMKKMIGLNNSSTNVRSVPYVYKSGSTYTGYLAEMTDAGRNLLKIGKPSSGYSWPTISSTGSVLLDNAKTLLDRLDIHPGNICNRPAEDRTGGGHAYGESPYVSSSSSVGKSTNPYPLKPIANAPISVKIVARSIYYRNGYRYFTMSNKCEDGSHVKQGQLMVIISNEDQGNEFWIKNYNGGTLKMNGGYCGIFMYMQRYENASKKGFSWVLISDIHDRNW